MFSFTFSNDENSTEEFPPEKGFKRGYFLILISFLSAIIGGIIASILIFYILGLNPIDLAKGRYKTPVIERRIILKKDSKLLETDSTIAVAQKVQPSVVNIRTTVSPGFFGLEERKGIGSGVIFRSDGYILTNNHVVEDAEEIWVTIGDEPDVRGKVVGRDPQTDLAVVKVSKKNLPAAELGSSARLKVGELAVAIGSPFGFEHTVTAGVISALNRDFSVTLDNGETATYTGLIQTDAAINPGNSGGALANEAGQVVGINFLIASTTGGSQGVGFAIPIDLAQDVAAQLIEKGKVSHSYVGIVGSTVDREVAEKHNLFVKEGAIIVRVAPNTPAAKAGLKVGDVIVFFDSKSIKNMDGLISAIRKKKVGDRVKITYFRKKEKKTVELTLAEKPRSFR